MIHIITALIPVFSLIIIGYFFKKIKFPSLDFWPMADKLTYYILMPSLLVYKLSSANIEAANSFNFVLTAILCIFTILLILILTNKFLHFKDASFTSVVQGGIRFNTYVFLALCSSIFGNDGLILAAILITFIIPLINIICISIFALYLSENKINFIYLLKSILTNPLILACFFGGSLNFFALELPLVIEKILAILSQAALPMGLLSVGFALVLKDMKNSRSEIFTSSFAKLFLSPLLMYIFASFFNLNEVMTSILIIFATLPTAPSSFIFARQLKGDVKLMSSIISVQTLLSIFVIIIVLQYFI